MRRFILILVLLWSWAGSAAAQSANFDSTMAQLDQIMVMAEEYSRMVDQALLKYVDDKDEELLEMRERIEEKAALITQRTKELQADLDYYNQSGLALKHRDRMQALSHRYEEVVVVLGKAYNQVVTLSQLMAQRSTIEMLKFVASIFESYYVNQGKYPLKIDDQLKERLPHHYYDIQYIRKDDHHFELRVNPRQDTLDAEQVGSEQYVLTEKKVIEVRNRAGVLIEEVKIDFWEMVGEELDNEDVLLEP